MSDICSLFPPFGDPWPSCLLPSHYDNNKHIFPLTVWITTNCGKFFKRWENQTTWLASWEICMQLKKQQSKLDAGQQTGSKSGKEYVKAVYCLKESLGPRKENNSLKGPLLNHLTSEKTKYNFSSTLMLRASCICLGLITPCPETYHPLHLPRRLFTPCPTTNVISTKEYSKHPTWLTFPYHFHKPPYKFEASLIPLGAQPGR